MENRQQPLLDDLRSRIAQRQVVIIVGAGVSVAASNRADVASWPGLLRSGVAHVEALGQSLPSRWGARKREAIELGDMGELLTVAEEIARKLGAPRGGEYGIWLRESVGKLELTSRTVIDALLALGAPLCTTNYDGLLEAASGLEPVTWCDPARFERVLRGDEKAILHLHGYYRQPESVVLGLRSYEDVLGHESSQALLRALRTYKTLLFVGFGAGLADPNFKSFLDWSARVFPESAYRHYRLAKDADTPILQAEHGAGQRLFVIGYGPEYADLGPFLRRLPSVDTDEAATTAGSAPALGPRARESALVDAVAAYRAHIARSPRIQRIRFADVASRAEDRDGPPALERLPLFVLPKLEEYPRKNQSRNQNKEAQRKGAPSNEGAEDSDSYSIWQVLTKPENRLCLFVGSPGAGKTEVGLWLLAKLCTPGESLPDEWPPEIVPIRVEMRQFDHDAQRNGSPYDFVIHVERLQQTTPGKLDAARVRDLHQAGSLLWIFDGMDEVRSADSRQRYAEMILELLRDSQSRGLVTSRRVGCEALIEALGKCPVYELQEFDDAQIRTFLKNWYALEFAEDPELGLKRRERLALAIEQSRTVRDLCRNPLLLTLLALLNRGDELPRRRHKVFDRALDLMVGQWDANKHLTPDDGANALFDREDKLQFLRQLAWAMYQNHWPDSQSNLIEHNDLLRFTANFIKKQFPVDEDRAQSRARLLIADLEERNQTLAYLGNNLYGFVHKTFLEYLAAEALVRFLSSEEQVTRFVQDAEDQNSWEVLTLACGLLDDRDQTGQILRILQSLLAKLEYARRNRDSRYRSYAFITRCLAEVRKVQQEPMRSLALGLMRLFQQDAVADIHSGSGWWVEPEVIEALRFFGPRWPETVSWLQWAQRSEWRSGDRVVSSDIQGHVHQCVIATAAQEQRAPLLIALLGRTDDSYSGAMKVMQEASLLGPWTLEESLTLLRGVEQAGEMVHVHVGCQLAKDASPQVLRQLLQEPFHDRIRLYLARDSCGSSDQRVNELAWQTLFSLTRAPSDKIRAYAVNCLAPAGPHLAEVRHRFKELVESDRSVRVRYGAARALMTTTEREWALQQLLRLQEEQDPTVLSWLATDLENLIGYRESARALWIRLAQVDDKYRRAEALNALAEFHLDEETKGIITTALKSSPDLVRQYSAKLSLLFESNDPDIEKATLDAILKLPYYHDLHGSLAPHQSHGKIPVFNNYFRKLLDTDIDEMQRLHIAHWLYYAEQEDRDRKELRRLARESQNIAIRLEAAAVINDSISIMELARGAEKPEARRQAVWKLGWMSSRDQSLRPQLLEIARKDADPGVRWSAVQPLWQLAEATEQHELLHSIILGLARQTDNEEVQLEAAQQLALYPALVQIAEGAHDERIRLRAADALRWLDIRADMLRLRLDHRRRGRVYLSGRAVGHIEETEQGSRFLYDTDWLRRRDAEAVSLTLPLRPEPYESMGLHPFFENLLPEGAYLDLVAKKTNVARDDKFGLLLATCADCAGAVEVHPLLGSG